MSLSIAEFIDLLLAAAWRRRRLIILPILLFTGLSIVAGLFWPRMYATRTLLMLQERQAADPLSSGSAASREGRLKADEIDTLLKSDRVLASAILDINLGKGLMSAKDLEGAIKSLKKQISVGVVGSEFIEIELKQSDREGIGERLSIILTRFFERLLTREDSMKTARQFALEQRKRDLDLANKSLEDWVERYYATSGKAGFADLDKRIAELQARQAAAHDKLFAAANAILPGPVDATNIAMSLAAEQRLANTRLQTGLGHTPAPPQRPGQLKDLEAQLDAYQAISAEVSKALLGRAQAIAQKLRETTGGQPGDKVKEAAYQQWLSLDARFNEALAQYESHQHRAKKAVGPGTTPLGLIAPESIRMIDEPRDPVTPATSLMKIILACLGAGVGLGIGLAALAEQLDDRVYDSRDLNGIAGVDMVVRLPRLETDTMPEGEAAGASRRRRHLSVVSEG